MDSLELLLHVAPSLISNYTHLSHPNSQLYLLNLGVLPCSASFCSCVSALKLSQDGKLGKWDSLVSYTLGTLALCHLIPYILQAVVSYILCALPLFQVGK